MADGEVLGQPNHCIVERFSVGVVFAEDLTNSPGRLLVRPVGLKAKIAHGIKDAAVNRFQSVANIGKSPVYDDAHGVIDVGLLHLVFYADWDDFSLCLCFQYYLPSSRPRAAPFNQRCQDT